MQTNSPLMPREKLLKYGVEALEDHELLAIFLRTGIKGCPVMELSHNVLQHFGSLRTLLSADKEAFLQSKRIRHYAVYSTTSHHRNDKAVSEARITDRACI